MDWPRCLLGLGLGARSAHHRSGGEEDMAAAATSRGDALDAHGVSGATQKAHQDRWDIEIVDPFKAQGAKLLVQLGRIEVAEERLAGRGDTSCPLLVLGAESWIDPFARLAVVEYHLRTARMGGDLREGRTDRFFSQIGHDAEPSEEGADVRVESGLSELLGEVLVLEIHRSVNEGIGNSDAGFGEAPALLGLSGRMIDLENPQSLAKRIAVGEGVEPRPQHNQLAEAARFDTECERALSNVRARDHEEPHAALRLVDFRILPEEFRIKAEDRDRQGILENAALLQHLVRRAIGGGGKGGAAGFLFEHLASQ